MASAPGSTIEFTAAHKKITLRIGTDIFALLIVQLPITNWAVVPPIFLGFEFGRRRFSVVHDNLRTPFCGSLVFFIRNLAW